MAILRLREYERIRCADTFSPDERTILPAQMGWLERFSKRFQDASGTPVFKFEQERTLVAQNFVGVVNLGRHQVEVLPKVEGDATKVQRNLARMVAATMGLTHYSFEESQVGRVEETFLDVMIGLFCSELWKALRQGIVRRYEIYEENLVVLRGRLSVSQQIRHNLGRPDRLYCAFDEFTADNRMNRALKAALRVLLSVVRSERGSRSVSELLFCFQDVEDVAPASIDWTLVQTDRLSSRYAPLLRMAQVFVEGASPDVVAGRGAGFSLLFDMNELFEKYIGTVAFDVFGSRGLVVGLQAPTRHLALTEMGRPAFELRPDIVVSSLEGPEYIIDTKWKRLKEEASREAVSQADMYQMFAYGHRYSVSEVILLYPHHAGLGAWKPRRATYLVDAPVAGLKRMAFSVVVSSIELTDLCKVPAQLAAISPGGQQAAA